MVMSMDASSDQIMNSSGSPIDDPVARGSSSLRHQESAGDEEQNDDEQSKDSAQTVVTSKQQHQQQLSAQQQQPLQEQRSNPSQQPIDSQRQQHTYESTAMIVSRGSSMDDSSEKQAMNVDSTENDSPKQESTSSNIIIAPIARTHRQQETPGEQVEDVLLAQMREIVGVDPKQNDCDEKTNIDQQQQGTNRNNQNQQTTIANKDSSGDSPNNNNNNTNNQEENNNNSKESVTADQTRRHSRSRSHCSKHHHHHAHHHQHPSNNGHCHQYHHHHNHRRKSVAAGSGTTATGTYGDNNNENTGNVAGNVDDANESRPGSGAQVTPSHQHHQLHGHHHHHHHQHRHRHRHHAGHHHHHHHRHSNHHSHDHHQHQHQQQVGSVEEGSKQGTTNLDAEEMVEAETSGNKVVPSAIETKSSTSSFSSAAFANQKQQDQLETTELQQQQKLQHETNEDERLGDNHSHGHHRHHHHSCAHHQQPHHHPSMQKLSDTGEIGANQHPRHAPHHHHHCHHPHHHHRGHKKRTVHDLGDNNRTPSKEPKNSEKPPNALSSLPISDDGNRTGSETKQTTVSMGQMDTDLGREPLREINNANKGTCCVHHDQTGSGTSLQSSTRGHSHHPHHHHHHHHHHHRHVQNPKSSDEKYLAIANLGEQVDQDEGGQNAPAGRGTQNHRHHHHHHHHHHHRHHRHNYHHSHAYQTKSKQRSKHKVDVQAKLDEHSSAGQIGKQLGTKDIGDAKVDSGEWLIESKKRDDDMCAVERENRMHLDQEEAQIDVGGVEQGNNNEVVRMEMSPGTAQRSSMKLIETETLIESTASDSNMITCIDMGESTPKNEQGHHPGDMTKIGSKQELPNNMIASSILPDESKKVDLNCDLRGQEISSVSGNRSEGAPKQHQRVARQESSSSSRENSKRSQRGIASGTGGCDGTNNNNNNNNRDDEIDFAPSQVVEISVTNQQPSSLRPRQISVANDIPTDRRCRLCWCCCCPCSALSSRASMSKSETKTSSEPSNSPANKCPSLPNVPLDEIRSWGESFDKLMKCEEGRKVFQDFLRCEYSEENILFWIACEELKAERDAASVATKARDIYEDYISILSAKEVSLDSRVRDIINNNIKKPTSNIFDEAQLQIYTLMHRDSYPRFINSHMYKRLAQLPTSSRKSSS